jgi:hypothetical protein
MANMKDVGIGTATSHDKQKYEYLIKAIRYITKRDQFIVHKRLSRMKRMSKTLEMIKPTSYVFGKNIAKDVDKMGNLLKILVKRRHEMTHYSATPQAHYIPQTPIIPFMLDVNTHLF